MGHESKASRVRRLVIGAAVVGVVIALVVGIASVLGGDDAPIDSRAGSVLVEESPSEPLATTDEPDEVRIDYRVEVGPVDDVVIATDRLWVQRPFASRLETYDGADIGDTPASVEISAFGRQRAEGRDTTPVVLAVPPSPGLTDTRIRGSLDAAVSDGRVERRERRSVLGRECDVYRSLTSLAASDLVPATETEHTDTCIDAAGLVLEEVATFQEERISRRLAIDIDEDPVLAAELFDTGEPTLAPDDGGGFLAELVPGSRAPGVFHEPSGPPPGFALEGRYAVIPPQAQNFSDPDRRGQRRTFVSDVFVRGADVIVFDQGSTLGNVDPFPNFAGVAVTVEAFDDVEVSYARTGPIVLADLGAGRFLRLRGTTTPDVLVDLLASMVQVEGGELELLDPPS